MLLCGFTSGGICFSSGAERSVATHALLIPRLESQRLPIQPDYGALEMELRCGQPLTVRFERGPLFFVSLFDLFDEIYDACTVAAALHATMPCFIAVRCITFHFVSHTRDFLVTMETRGGRRGSSRRIIRGNSLRIS